MYGFQGSGSHALVLGVLVTSCIVQTPSDADENDDDGGFGLAGGAAGAAGKKPVTGGTNTGGTNTGGATTGGATTGGATTGGTSTGGTTTGMAGAGAVPACRTYATAMTFTSSLGASSTSTCSHSETTSGFDRSCTTSSFTTVEHWANKGAFIDEAAAIGIAKILSTSNSAGQATYQYDAQGRLTSYSAAGSLYATYDAWDALGRVTHAVFAGSCAGSTGAVSYNDAARSITSAVGGTCASRTTVFYDANVIPVSIDYGDGTTGTYTTTARANVCR